MSGVCPPPPNSGFAGVNFKSIPVRVERRKPVLGTRKGEAELKRSTGRGAANLFSSARALSPHMMLKGPSWEAMWPFLNVPPIQMRATAQEVNDATGCGP